MLALLQDSTFRLNYINYTSEGRVDSTLPKMKSLFVRGHKNGLLA